VTAPFGEGHTAEEQITGNAVHGGAQFIVYRVKAERYAEIQRPQLVGRSRFELMNFRAGCGSLGLAPSGRMKQEIHDDECGLDAWGLRNTSRCIVTIANAVAWQAITSEMPSGQPTTASRYSNAGLRWVDYSDSKRETVAEAKTLAVLRTYLEYNCAARSADSHRDKQSHIGKIVQLKDGRPRDVREPAI
jgi:hypothetical protein